MSAPLAYLITWTTHGTWLHGDERGSADRRTERSPGSPYLPANTARVAFERAELVTGAFTLSNEARAIVDATIREHCELRKWNLHALNVRSNHVHLVVVAPVAPETVMGQCKAWASRRLREAGLVEERTQVWTRHGSTRYLNTRASVDGAVRYVLDGQGPNSIDT